MTLPMEAKRGIIPRVVKHGFGSTREYSILLTDRRMIFVMASLSRAHLAAAAIGGALGALVAPAPRDASGQGVAQASSEEPDALAATEGSLTIPYSGLDEFRLKKYPADYELIVDYRDDRGKKDRIRVQVVVPDAYFEQSRAQGIDGKTIRRNYALAIQSTVLQSFPPDVATRARWDF